MPQYRPRPKWSDPICHPARLGEARAPALGVLQPFSRYVEWRLSLPFEGRIQKNAARQSWVWERLILRWFLIEREWRPAAANGFPCRLAGRRQLKLITTPARYCFQGLSKTSHGEIFWFCLSFRQPG